MGNVQTAVGLQNLQYHVKNRHNKINVTILEYRYKILHRGGRRENMLIALPKQSLVKHRKYRCTMRVFTLTR